MKLAGTAGGRMFVDLFGAPIEYGTAGLAVIELKVTKSAARQSFTELLGYGQGLASSFPGLSRQDIIHVLVAPISTGPEILRKSLIAAMVFDRRQVLALEPVFAGGLRLVPWIPNREDVQQLTKVAFRPANLSLHKQAWGGKPGAWKRRRMDNVGARAALVMEAQGIHGFCFAATAWPNSEMVYPHSLACVGVNPFRVAQDEYLLRKGVAFDKLPNLDVRLRLRDVLPGMRRSPKDGEGGDSLEDLARVWSDHVSRIAENAVRDAVLSVGGQQGGTDSATFSWDQYASVDEESRFQDEFSVFQTGAVRELYETVARMDYAVGAVRAQPPPHSSSSGRKRFVVDELADPGRFRSFMKRMTLGLPGCRVWWDVRRLRRRLPRLRVRWHGLDLGLACRGPAGPPTGPIVRRPLRVVAPIANSPTIGSEKAKPASTVFPFRHRAITEEASLRR
jgi:hypothetical protein